MSASMGKWSLWYALIQRLIRLCVYVYYRPVIVGGKENIPKNDPVIFAGNHQSAFMDALVISVTCGRQPAFLVRADVFRRKLDQSFYNSLKMMPVYRQVDGMDNLQRNEDIFQQCEDILSEKGCIIIFPEGSQNHRRRLRPMKKGITRIAFRTESKFNFSHGLKIVPVGINFESHTRFRRKLYIRYGNPIPIAQYEMLYAEHPQKAMSKLREDLFEGLLKEIVHIDQKDWYYTIRNASDVVKQYVAEYRGLDINRAEDEFKIEKSIGSALTANDIVEENYSEMESKLEQIRKFADEAGLPFDIIKEQPIEKLGFALRLMGFIAFIPICFIGILVNVIPYGMVASVVGRRVKDIHFIASVKLITGLIFFGTFYILSAIAALFILPYWWMAVLWLLVSGLSGLTAWHVLIWFRNTRLRHKLSWHLKDPNNPIHEMMAFKRELEQMVLPHMQI